MVTLYIYLAPRTRARDARCVLNSKQRRKSIGGKVGRSESGKEIANRSNETSAIIYPDKQVGSSKSDYGEA